MLADAGRARQGLLATFLGIGALLFAAIGVVVQLKDALNTVWKVGDLPGRGLWHFMRSYLVSLAAFLALGFLLLVSLVVTAGLAAFGNLLRPICRSGLSSCQRFGFAICDLCAVRNDVQVAPGR